MAVVCLDTWCARVINRRSFEKARGSSNGRTADSDSAYLGSNPSPRTRKDVVVEFGFLGPVV